MNKFSFNSLGKRGFTYLLVTSFMVVVILMLFFTTNKYSHQDAEDLQQIRIRSMNDFIKNLNTDIHRAAYISAFRTMLALEDHITTSGEYYTDINSSFKETFFYGTINSTNSTIMQNSTFSDYLLRVQQVAGSTGIFLDINVTEIQLWQPTPWDIAVYVVLNITAIDNKGTATWNIYKGYTTEFSIYNLRDPLYSKNTLNRVPNTVRVLENISIGTGLLVNGTNTSVLQQHIEGSYYIESTNAPNFIMRFEGLTTPDPNGIESIVNIQSLSDQELTVYDDRVKVDYIYFNDLSTDKACDIEFIPSSMYFVIPTNRRNLYQVDSLDYSTTCP